MRQKRKTLPSVLLAILSTLGILIGLFVIGVFLFNLFHPQPHSTPPPGNIETYSNYAIIFLAFTICVANALTLSASVQYLRKKQLKPLPSPKTASKITLFVLWVLSLIGGYFASQNQSWYPALALMTTIALPFPILLLIMIARSGLPHSTRQRELGTITLGLTISPFLIIVIESILLLLVVITVFIFFGMRNQLPQQILQLMKSLENASDGIDQLETLLFNLMKEPIIALAVYLSLGVIAPMIEEIFKPMAIWFLVNRPLRDHEGYTLGLISGGVFALMESAGMVIQINPQDWLASVVLRAATGVLHIGLSGLVGFGLVRSITIHKPKRGFLSILLAGALHGAWNSLALYSGLAALPALENSAGYQPNAEIVITIILMGIVFSAVITINFFINRFLRRHSPEQSNFQNLVTHLTKRNNINRVLTSYNLSDEKTNSAKYCPLSFANVDRYKILRSGKHS